MVPRYQRWLNAVNSSAFSKDQSKFPKERKSKFTLYLVIHIDIIFVIKTDVGHFSNS